MAIYEVPIWHFVVGVQARIQHENIFDYTYRQLSANYDYN